MEYKIIKKIDLQVSFEAHLILFKASEKEVFKEYFFTKLVKSKVSGSV